MIHYFVCARVCVCGLCVCERACVCACACMWVWVWVCVSADECMPVCSRYMATILHGTISNFTRWLTNKLSSGHGSLGLFSHTPSKFDPKKRPKMFEAK